MKANELSSANAATEIHRMVKKAATGELVGFLITLDTSTGEVETVSIGVDYPREKIIELLTHVQHRLRQTSEVAPVSDAEGAN
tara:strand:+ start:8884 stop:9132 length:249 start_codon:yes stop_codon:yes gene_type:complete